ncbi:hypothetical protein PLICRDRAFT_481425 [Plicaturopsis crispa FD-325 SS-3]|nr:hypothetical protein PLICRDRAFT_481425 [Plicaturopsis crispa FD-325 SS-3]
MLSFESRFQLRCISSVAWLSPVIVLFQVFYNLTATTKPIRVYLRRWARRGAVHTHSEVQTTLTTSACISSRQLPSQPPEFAACVAAPRRSGVDRSQRPVDSTCHVTARQGSNIPLGPPTSFDTTLLVSTHDSGACSRDAEANVRARGQTRPARRCSLRAYTFLFFSPIPVRQHFRLSTPRPPPSPDRLSVVVVTVQPRILITIVLIISGPSRLHSSPTPSPTLSKPRNSTEASREACALEVSHPYRNPGDVGAPVGSGM